MIAGIKEVRQERSSVVGTGSKTHDFGSNKKIHFCTSSSVTVLKLLKQEELACSNSTVVSDEGEDSASKLLRIFDTLSLKKSLKLFARRLRSHQEEIL